MNRARNEPTESYTSADGVAETAQTLASKLESVGHVSPSIQMTPEESRNRARDLCQLDDDEGMRRYLRARDAYLAEIAAPTWKDKVGMWLQVLWHKCWTHLVFIALISATTGACVAVAQ
jgi:hypothetical protein